MIDSCYNAVETLKRSIQDELRNTTDLLERYELEFFLQRLDTLSPMNAGGFFSITNGSLTSMVSVRLEYQRNKCLIISNLSFSVTYIIILVQFQMSSEPSSMGCPFNYSVSQTE